MNRWAALFDYWFVGLLYLPVWALVGILLWALYRVVLTDGAYFAGMVVAFTFGVILAVVGGLVAIGWITTRIIGRLEA